MEPSSGPLCPVSETASVSLFSLKTGPSTWPNSITSETAYTLTFTRDQTEVPASARSTEGTGRDQLCGVTPEPPGRAPTSVRAGSPGLRLPTSVHLQWGARLDDRGLRLQEGWGAGAAVELQGVLRVVPRDRRAAEPVVQAAGPSGAHAAPLPFQLALHLGEDEATRKRGSGGRGS